MHTKTTYDPLLSLCHGFGFFSIAGLKCATHASVILFISITIRLCQAVGLPPTQPAAWPGAVARVMATGAPLPAAAAAANLVFYLAVPTPCGRTDLGGALVKDQSADCVLAVPAVLPRPLSPGRVDLRHPEECSES